MSVFSIFLFFSQIDMLLVRMLADIIITTITTHWWMQPKTVDREKYSIEGGHVTELSVVRIDTDTVENEVDQLLSDHS